MNKTKKIALSLFSLVLILSQMACGVKMPGPLNSLFMSYDYDTASEEMEYSAPNSGAMLGRSASMKQVVMAETQASNGEIENGNTTDPRKLIKNVYISAETKNFDEAITNLEEEVVKYNGIIDSRSQNNGGKYNNFARSNHFTIRIPAESLDEFLNTVKGEINITSMSDDVVDVTDNYQYTLRRQQTLINELEKLNELLKKATNVSDVVTIEEKIGEINLELQSIENSLKNLDKRINYSTVNISLMEVKELTDMTKVPTKETLIEGFMSNLRLTGDFLIRAGIYIVTHAVSILLTIFAIIILVLILKLIRRIIVGPSDLESIKKKEERKQLKAEKKLEELNKKIAIKEAKEKLKNKKRQEKEEKELEKELKKEFNKEQKKDKNKKNNDDDFDFPESDPEQEKIVMDIDDIEDIEDLDTKDNMENENDKTIEDVFNNTMDRVEDAASDKLDKIKNDLDDAKKGIDEIKKDVKNEVKEAKEEIKNDIKTDEKGNKIIDLDFEF